MHFRIDESKMFIIALVKRAEFYILKYLPVLTYITLCIPYIIPESPKPISDGHDSVNIIWMGIATITLIVAIVFFESLDKLKVTRVLFGILVSLEVIYYISNSNLTNSISLIYPITFYLLLTLFGRNFASGKKDNNLVHLLTGIGSIIMFAYSQYSYFYFGAGNGITLFLEAEYFMAWFAIVLMFMHWRSNVGIISTKEKAIDSTKSQLELSNKVLSLIGHNIRTPLTNLSLQLQIAKRSEPKNERYEQLIESVDRLIDITEATIIQNKPIESGEASSIELVQEIQKIYNDRVEITVDNSVYFHNQPNISQIFLCLQNVLDNAIYWSPNSKPRLHIQLCEYKLCMRIEDGGRGMSYSAAQNYGSKMAGGLNATGKGIGMYYSIKLVNQLGFNLHLRTRENVGTQILICNDAKRELEFASAEGWLHKSFYQNSSDENLIVDKISNY